jgi:hypothetical protein
MPLSSIWQRKRQNAIARGKSPSMTFGDLQQLTLHNAKGDELDWLGMELDTERNARESREYRHALFSRALHKSCHLMRNGTLPTSTEENELIRIAVIVGASSTDIANAPTPDDIINLIDRQFTRFVEEHVACRFSAHGKICSCNL